VRIVFTETMVSRTPDADAPRSWRQRPDAGGGVPHDWVCYVVNACNHFSDAVPSRVSAIGYRHPVFDTIHRLYGTIEYPNGVVGIAETSQQASFVHETNAAGHLGRLRLPVPLSAEHDAGITHDAVPPPAIVAERTVHHVP